MDIELSYDNRYLATVNENSKVIYVWDFDSIIEAGSGDRDLSVLKNYSLKCPNNVREIYFKCKLGFWNIGIFGENIDLCRGHGA